jgi:hypothetical protein
LKNPEESPGCADQASIECARRKNAGPTDKECGSQRNSGETYGLSCLERAARKRCQIISCAEGGGTVAKVNPFGEDRAPSECKPAGQLKLARGAGGGQDLPHIIGKITRRVLEDGITVTSKGKRTLCITRNAKIRMIE